MEIGNFVYPMLIQGGVFYRWQGPLSCIYDEFQPGSSWITWVWNYYPDGPSFSLPEVHILARACIKLNFFSMFSQDEKMI